MASGLNVRDFFKEYRELRYENSGSIGFTDVEKNAYRLSLTLEVTHVDAPRYSSLKTLPENTHYGYLTLFRGSTVTETIPIKYPKFRVFDIRNQAIWNYHQANEIVRVLGGAAEQVAVEASNLVVSSLDPSFQAVLCFAIRLVLSEQGEQDLGWILSVLGCDSGPEPASGVEQYRAFPIASPFPDIAKFKADIPCSFLWRLEAWYLYEPEFYESNAPTDDGDATEGENEFPNPEQGDGDGDGDEFPPADPPGEGRDPRDFSGGSVPPGAGVTFEVEVLADPGFCQPGVPYTAGPFGPFRGFGIPVATLPTTPVPGCESANYGFRVQFEDGTVLGPFEEGAGVYSATIVNVQIVE